MYILRRKQSEQEQSDSYYLEGSLHYTFLSYSGNHPKMIQNQLRILGSKHIIRRIFGDPN